MKKNITTMKSLTVPAVAIIGEDDYPAVIRPPLTQQIIIKI